LSAVIISKLATDSDSSLTLCFAMVAAYFWGGQRGVSGSTPDQSGLKIPDENGR